MFKSTGIFFAICQFTLLSCDRMVTDMPVTCINKLDTTINVAFFITDYPALTISNIITDNEIPIQETVYILPKDTNIVTIYEPDRLGIWFGAYIGKNLYQSGKVVNSVILIE